MDCPPVKKIELDDEAHLKKYIMWENKSNICWLDSSMALVAHNKAMKKYCGISPQCSINKIISAYDDAISIINGSEKTMDQKLNLARGRLNYIQESTLEYLQPILKYKTGDPESAFCSLYNLLIQDPVIKKIFDITWLSVKECTDCGNHSESTKSKPIITLSKIDSFDPENLTVVYRCGCNKSEQKIKLVYVSLPPCLIFHFENGAGNEKPPLSFITQGREYHLTGIMTLEKSQDSTVNHFITWVRDPTVDKWLDCNDLNLDTIYFSPDFPDINIKDVYMYVYEAFDDLGTITDAKLIKAKKSEENIPCFDLSEESDTEISDSQSSATESIKNTSKMKILEPDLKSSSAKLDSNTSLKRSLSTDKSTVEKNIQPVNFTEHLKNTSNNRVNVNINESQIKPKEASEVKIHGKNKRTRKNKVLTTLSITDGSILTSTDGNNLKAINESICKSNVSACDDKITEKINENSRLFPSPKDASLNLEDRHDDLMVKDTISVEREPSFDNEKKCVSMNTSKNIQNTKLLSKEVCSNKSSTAIPKSLKNLKIRDLIKLRCSDKTNVKKDMSNSEQLFTISNAEQRHNDRLILTSNGQEKLSGHFLADAGASSSGTSYVKLSVRRKKISSDPSCRTNTENDAENPNLNEAFHNMTDATPSTSTSLKRVAEDSDYVPLSEKSKKKKLSNVGKDSVSPKKRAQEEDLKNTKKKSQVKSKLSNTSKKTVDNSGLDAVKQEDSNDPRNSLSDPGFEAGASENVNANSDGDVKILKDFGDVWTCHETGCNCEFADLEEIVDSGVDFVFSYFCKLSQEFQKFSK